MPRPTCRLATTQRQYFQPDQQGSSRAWASRTDRTAVLGRVTDRSDRPQYPLVKPLGSPPHGHQGHAPQGRLSVRCRLSRAQHACGLVVPLVWTAAITASLNPIDRPWLYLKDRFRSHRLWPTYGDIGDAVCRACDHRPDDNWRIKSLCLLDWALSVKNESDWYWTSCTAHHTANSISPNRFVSLRFSA